MTTEYLQLSSEYSAAGEDLDKGDYRNCVNRCGKILEHGLRQLLADLLINLDSLSDRRQIERAEEELGKGKDTFVKFGLGQLCGLYRKAGVFELLAQKLKSNLSRTKHIDWNLANEWRTEVAHNKGQTEITEDDARQMLIWTKVFLYDCGLISKPSPTTSVSITTSNRQDKCPSCSATLQERWKYCPMCGLGTKLDCPNCKRSVEADWKLCPHCGAPIQTLAREILEPFRGK